ncbi:MAG: sugar transferase [Epsilonproteobacteria bacterium]|nr:sugar transferase [Campylobacterota bacterium]
MKDIIAKSIYIIIDIGMIVLSVYLAFLIRESFETLEPHTIAYSTYLTFYPLYIIIFSLFTYEGIYTYRYDFWHESRIIFKVIIFSAILVFAYLAMTKLITDYSRLVIGMSFIIMMIMIPLAKNITKKLLYKLGLWQKKAKVYGNDAFLTTEIYRNPYLGYIKPKSNQEPDTVFINSKDNDVETLKKIISSEIQEKHEVIFVPLMNDYNLTQSHIYELSNTRTNLIVFSNRLKSKYRLVLKNIFDFLLSLFIFPFLIPIMLYIAFRLRQTEPKESIIFTQARLGKDGEIFICYKFRTMHENSDALLAEYLNTYPEEIDYYNKYHKYQNDPRVTKFGQLLRKTSLDELPQIFNVLKNEMSFIGPRPYMIEEESKIGDNCATILAVKPGITGLWQVSGRSDVDFKSRVELDVWYIQNWNLWMDLVILIKTVKTVLFRDGAQ